MKTTRYLIIIMLPFLAAALLPWLAPDAVARVAALSVFWAGVLNVFMAGFIVGDSVQQMLQSDASGGRIRLRIISAVALVALTLMAAALHLVWSPMASIIVMASALYFNSHLLRSTDYGCGISALDYAFFQKNVWVALGCLLMLLLSYYRYFNEL